jgi:hypothetical protein
MPHWYGVVSTASPPFIRDCNGEPMCVKRAILANAPEGANVRTFNWHKGEKVVGVTVEGPTARDYLSRLAADPVIELEETGPV